MAIFLLGRLGLAERPLAPDRLMATLEKNYHRTQAAAFAVLVSLSENPSVIAALKRHLAKCNSVPIRDFLGRIEFRIIVDEVRY